MVSIGNLFVFTARCGVTHAQIPLVARQLLERWPSTFKCCATIWFSLTMETSKLLLWGKIKFKIISLVRLNYSYKTTHHNPLSALCFAAARAD